MENEKKITVEQVLMIANGVSVEGEACSSASLAIDRYENEEFQQEESVFFQDAVPDIHDGSASIVLAFNFPKKSKNAFLRAKKMLDNWFSMPIEETRDKLISLTLVPYQLGGYIYLFFCGLVFADGYETNDYCRLILCFDRPGMSLVETDLEYSKIYEQVTAELNKYEEDIDADIARYQQEEKECEEQMNKINMEMNERINNPLDYAASDEEVDEDEELDDYLEEFGVDPEHIRSKERSNYRFVDDDDDDSGDSYFHNADA